MIAFEVTFRRDDGNTQIAALGRLRQCFGHEYQGGDESYSFKCKSFHDFAIHVLSTSTVFNSAVRIEYTYIGKRMCRFQGVVGDSLALELSWEKLDEQLTALLSQPESKPLAQGEWLWTTADWFDGTICLQYVFPATKIVGYQFAIHVIPRKLPQECCSFDLEALGASAMVIMTIPQWFFHLSRLKWNRAGILTPSAAFGPQVFVASAGYRPGMRRSEVSGWFTYTYDSSKADYVERFVDLLPAELYDTEYEVFLKPDDIEARLRTGYDPYHPERRDPFNVKRM